MYFRLREKEKKVSKKIVAQFKEQEKQKSVALRVSTTFLVVANFLENVFWNVAKNGGENGWWRE